MRIYPGKPFRLPYERGQMMREFWPPRTAARILGMSWREVRRWMLLHHDQCAYVRIQRADGQVEWVYCVIVDELPYAAEKSATGQSLRKAAKVQ